MKSSHQPAEFETTTRQIDEIVSAVIERGYDDTRQDFDDYGALIQTFEFRKLVTFELYESYFPPKRHEFELQLLTFLVDAVASNPAVIFVGGAIAGGILGNAAYAFLDQLLPGLKSKLRPIKRSYLAVSDIEKRIKQTAKFFEKRDQARMTEICDALDAEPAQVEPLLKLLGFRCHRKGKRRVWMVPLATHPNGSKKRK